MLQFLSLRLLIAVPVLFGALLFGFLLMRVIPGNPAALLAGQDASQQTIERLEEELGLDQPLPVQFATYMGQVLRGDLGRSIISNRPVLEELLDAVGPTVELVLAAVIIGVPLGIALGTCASIWRGTVIDRAVMAVSVAGISLPVFWVAYMLILLVGVRWGLLPFTGRSGPIWTAGGLAAVALPAVTAAVTLVGPIARITRASMLENLRAEHVRLARAKGLSEPAVIFRHALRNALLPVVTLIGLQIGHLLGGTVIIETIFAWPGVGRLVVGAIMNSDYATAQGGLIAIAITFIAINLMVDLLYILLDPRTAT